MATSRTYGELLREVEELHLRAADVRGDATLRTNHQLRQRAGEAESALFKLKASLARAQTEGRKARQQGEERPA